MSFEDDPEGEVARLMAEAKQQQDELAKVRDSVLATELVGSAERGAVTVKMSGGGRFTSVTIEPDAVRRFDSHVLGEVVLEAIHDAMGKLADLSKEKFGPFLGDPGIIEETVTYWKPEDRKQQHHR
ncbi:MAG: YbaB/EbfC family nucleoid-associated protein [Nocardioides sp.]